MDSPLTPEQLRAALTNPEIDVPAVRPRMLRRDQHHRVIPRPSGPPPGQKAGEAAVLVPIYYHEGQLWIAYTRRPDYMKRHSGQISFPGGRVDPQDKSYLDTALREANEEVGLDPGILEFWTELKPIYITASSYHVYPFVMYCDRRPDFKPDPGEVAELIEVPLSTLLDPANFSREMHEFRGQLVWEPFFRYGPHKIWGATAIITDQILAHLPGDPGQQDWD